MRNVNWTRILTILLVILAAYAVLYVTGSILGRFRHVIVIFMLGALTAYVLSPLVNRLEIAFRIRWVAILLAYLIVATALFTLAVFLFTPFIQQSQSLVDNLHTPSTKSLQSIVRVECAALLVQNDLEDKKTTPLCGTMTLPPGSPQHVSADLDRLNRDISGLTTGVISGPVRGTREPVHTTPGRQPPNPGPQTQVPPSYIKAIEAETQALTKSYQDGLSGVVPVTTSSEIKKARKLRALARAQYNTMASTPILLLRAQTWLDQHAIGIDVHGKFGQAARQLSNQGTLLLNNAVTILQETANTLLNVTLIMIIAFYFLSDGRRLVLRTVDLVPTGYREQVWYFVSSLDRVLGGYIRGQLFLSALAGILGGAGAAALGVPYPLLIGILTFLLESVPVVGPLVALVPAVAVSLFFMPLFTTVLLLVWNILFQQLVTNILGPRLLGIAVGIHPLEAMLAVLVGYPLAGFLGAFLAVPVAGVLHIVIREFYHYFAHGTALPTAILDAPADTDRHAESEEPSGVVEHPEARPAAG